MSEPPATCYQCQSLRKWLQSEHTVTELLPQGEWLVGAGKEMVPAPLSLHRDTGTHVLDPTWSCFCSVNQESVHWHKVKITTWHLEFFTILTLTYTRVADTWPALKSLWEFLSASDQQKKLMNKLSTKEWKGTCELSRRASLSGRARSPLLLLDTPSGHGRMMQEEESYTVILVPSVHSSKTRTERYIHSWSNSEHGLLLSAK